MVLLGGKRVSYTLVERGKAWRPECAAELADPEGLVEGPGSVILQRGRRTTVAKATVQGEQVILKLFSEAGPGQWLQAWILGSAAKRAARSARCMSQAGFVAPQLVAVLEKRSLLGCERSCLVTTVVGGGTVEDAWEGLGRNARLRLAAELGAYVGSLHQAGVYPQDLRSANIMACWKDGRWEFVLVDLDRVRSYARLSRKRRVKNLVQLRRSIGRVAPAREQACFLRSYLGRASKEQRKEFASRVLTMTARKEREYRRRRSKMGRGIMHPWSS